MIKRNKQLLVFSAVVLTIVLILVYSTRAKPVLIQVQIVEMEQIEETVANARAVRVMPCRDTYNIIQ